MAKLIKAVFGAGQMSRTCPQWQYDYNTILQFVGLDLPTTFEVDLANSKTGQSTTVLGDADGCCTIPAQYFIPGTSIFAWAYIVDSNSGYTRCQVEIPIHPRAQHTGDPPTPEQQSALDQAIALLNAATENIPNEINTALQEAKESGEFDGKDGTHIWWTTARVLPYGSGGGVATRQLNGVGGSTPAVRDYVFAPEIEQSGEPTTLYVITRTTAVATAFDRLCSIKGTNGTSPTVTITEITGGHRVTITDEAHPDGQSFDVMDGQGGSGTGDYDDLTNKPSIEGVTLSGNKTAAQLGLAKASDIPTVPVQSVNNKTGAVVLNASDVGAGTYTKPSGGIPKSDLASAVQTSLGKADTALQTAPVTSVNGQTGAVTLSIPSTASDVGAVAANQGATNFNKVLTVDLFGNVVPEDTSFVVTFTPTSPDYSGTIDKTPADIADAYEARKRIIAYAPAFNFRCELSLATIKSGGLYTFDFIALGELNGQDIMLRLLTSDSASTFTTKIYPLATGQWTGGSY